MSIQYTHVDEPSWEMLIDKKKFLVALQTYPIVVVDTYTDWCGPCKHVGPLFEKLALFYKNNKNIAFFKENVEDEETYHKPHAVPTFYFYVKAPNEEIGKVIHQESGGDIVPIKKKIEALFQQMNLAKI